MKFLTNVRPTKNLGSVLTVSCTKGQLKLTPEAADTLKVSVGAETPEGVERHADYVTIIELNDGSFAIAKGTQDGMGNKLASSNAGGGGILTFSSANAWDGLNGDEDFNTDFEVSDTALEGEEAEEAAALGYILYPITFSEKVAKVARKSTKSEAGDASHTLAPAQPINTIVNEDDMDTSFENM